MVCPEGTIVGCKMCGLILDATAASSRPGFMFICDCPRVVWIGDVTEEGLESMFSRLEKVKKEMEDDAL
jgi:hypothetical protein